MPVAAVAAMAVLAAVVAQDTAWLKMPPKRLVLAQNTLIVPTRLVAQNPDWNLPLPSPMVQHPSVAAPTVLSPAEPAMAVPASVVGEGPKPQIAARIADVPAAPVRDNLKAKKQTRRRMGRLVRYHHRHPGHRHPGHRHNIPREGTARYFLYFSQRISNQQAH